MFSNDDHGFLDIHTFGLDGNIISFPTAEDGLIYDILRVVMVEINTDGQAGKSVVDPTKGYFEKIGVNPDNYREMEDYFNLD